METLERAVRTVDLPRFLRRQEAARAGGVSLGIGFATFSERTGYGTQAFAARKMDVVPGFETVELAMGPSGHVEARIGASPHGQGLETSLSQVIADELGLDPETITVIHGDTSRTPFGWGIFVSRSMVLSGGASKIAATTLRRRLAAIASGMLEAAVEDLVFEDGKVTVAGSDVGMPIQDLARIAYFQAQTFENGAEPGLRTTATYDPAGTFSNACHVAEVAGDLETGMVTIERYVVIEDAGLLINPMIADGQVHGGVAQGIGAALYEELKYDPDGNLLTSSLLDYLPPTALEIPTIEIDPPNLVGGNPHRSEGFGGRRHDRSTRCHRQCDQRRPPPPRRLHRRHSCDPRADSSLGRDGPMNAPDLFDTLLRLHGAESLGREYLFVRLARINIAGHVDYSEISRILTSIRRRSQWFGVWMEASARHESLARSAETIGATASAADGYLRAALCAHWSTLYASDAEHHRGHSQPGAI